MLQKGRRAWRGDDTPRRIPYVAGVLFFALGMLAVGSGEISRAEITPPVPPPEITVTPGDGLVRVAWTRQGDSLLTASGVVDDALPEWMGTGQPGSGGIFDGLCDQDYQFEVKRFPLSQGRLIVAWYETPRGSLSLAGEIEIVRADTTYAFAGGLSFGVSSSVDLAVTPEDWLMTVIGAGPDTSWIQGGWNPDGDPDWSTPLTNGLFLRGIPGLVIFTAADSGMVHADRTEPAALSLDWSFTASDTDTVVATGTVVIPRADTLVSAALDSVVPGAPPDTLSVPFLRVGLGAGAVAAGDSFAVWGTPSAQAGDRVRLGGRTFEAYVIWNSEVIDLDVPIMREKIWRCGVDPESLGFFAENTLEYIDYEVHNGYPYYYAVTTSDLPPDSTDALSDSLWFALRRKVYPRRVECDSTFTQCTSSFRTADRVMVVPNPYKSFEEWEEGESKIQFVNLPPSSTVYVYTGAGDFVISLPQTDPASDRVSWNLRSGGGRDVVSGIYVYKVESPFGEKVGRFIVIR